MTQDPRHPEEDEISAKAPGGWQGKIRGYRIADIVLAALVIWGFGLKPYFDSQRENARDAALAKEHSIIAEAQTRMAIAFTEFSYILALPQEQRILLNLDMPQSLRDKLYIDPRRPVK